MYRKIFDEVSTDENVESVNLNTYMKKLHLMMKTTFEDEEAEIPGRILVCTYGKDAGELYKLKEYIMNPAFMNSTYEVMLSDVIDVDPIAALCIQVFSDGGASCGEYMTFDVEIEWEERGLC